MEIATGLRQPTELVEENGLAHTSETYEELRAAVALEKEALECDVHGLKEVVAADQRWRHQAFPGAVGVPDGIHPFQYRNCYRTK
jgi:ssDNA-binding Zn-finger/Zn-ribbon topoisomerase 1